MSIIPIVIGVTIVTFLLAHAAAGSIVPGLKYSPDLSPRDIANIRNNLGLNRPLPVQYLIWLLGLLHGSFGISMVNGVPVTTQIAQRLPNTLILTTTALVIGATLSIPIGILAALKRGTVVDHGLTVVSVLGFSIPQFWLGLIMIILFSIEFRKWGLPSLPPGGAESPVDGGGVLDRLVHLVMPATVLATFYICVWSRFVRSSMLEALTQDYVNTARAKGMKERRVIFVHALRNALIPVITLLGAELPALLSGGLVVEVVFSWPGIGYLAYQVALAHDYTTILGLTTFAALLVVIGNLLADVAYGLVDPRIRHS